jgi:hypothetical protein
MAPGRPDRRTPANKSKQTMKDALPAAAIVLTILAQPALAGKRMIACKDANGNPYFSDVGCPAETTSEGWRRAPEAQTYSGPQSIDTNMLNNYERRVGSGRQWQWVTKPAPAGSGH